MTRVWLDAPAKINLTLEVLGKRSDGYHEIRSVMQTIDLCDQLLFEESEDISIRVNANESWRVSAEANLACRAAQLLQERTHIGRGVRITLNKQIPVAAGLGGGSADAAASLRGLKKLWQLDISDDELTKIGAELGSDVPFLLQGGCALASGRGEELQRLPEPPRQHIYLLMPKHSLGEDKTARMYAALRSTHYTDGPKTADLVSGFRQRSALGDADLHNVFESLLRDVDREAADTFDNAGRLGLGRPHLCGSGPAFFFLMEPGPASLAAFRKALRSLPCTAIPTWTLSADEATRSMYDVS